MSSSFEVEIYSNMQAELHGEKPTVIEASTIQALNAIIDEHPGQHLAYTEKINGRIRHVDLRYVRRMLERTQTVENR